MLTGAHPRSVRRRRQQGLSLVELLVGIAVGMFVVAAASMLVSTQLSENRRLLAETQVQQDLRATADIITRELRRAGSWGTPATPAAAVWTETAAPTNNPLTTVSPSAGAATQVDYQSSRALGTSGPYGFRLNSGVIETRLAAAGWQQLTDPATLQVTAFNVTAESEPSIQLPCPKLCTDGTQDCWPTLTVRRLVVDITGQAVGDAAVVRSVRSVTRLRNDVVGFNDPLNPTLACPA